MTESKKGICADCGKDYSEIETICGHCGYSKHGATLGVNEAPHWQCGMCKRTVQAVLPPAKCPSCGEVCDFKNITCYTPDCGGPGCIDPQL